MRPRPLCHPHAVELNFPRYVKPFNVSGQTSVDLVRHKVREALLGVAGVDDRPIELDTRATSIAARQNQVEPPQGRKAAPGAAAEQ